WFTTLVGKRQHQVVVQVEVEHHVQARAVEKVVQLVYRFIDFTQQQHVRLQTRRPLVQVAQDVRRFRREPCFGERMLHDVRGRVDAESRYAEAQPIVQYSLDFIANILFCKVERRL